MADINLPIIGPTKKGTVIVMVVGGVGIAGYFWWKDKKKKATTNTAQNTAPTGTAYGYGSSVSATTYGYGYGAGYGYGYSGGGFGSGLGSGYYNYGYGTSITTNAQWTQYAATQLENSGGYSGATVLAALGLYIAGGSLNASQVSIVQQAIAVAGYPPSEGPNGYPPAINSQTSGGQTGTTPSGGTISVPNVVGQTKGNAHNLIVAAGLTPYDGDWKSGDAQAKVTGQTPSGGTMVNKGTKITYVG